MLICMLFLYLFVSCMVLKLINDVDVELEMLMLSF